MSEILSIGGGGNPVHGVGHRRPADALRSTGGERSGDTFEVSDRAQLLAKLAGLPDVRTDLVDSVRDQLAAGTYDADGSKFDAAFNALLGDLN